MTTRIALGAERALSGRMIKKLDEFAMNGGGVTPLLLAFARAADDDLFRFCADSGLSLDLAVNLRDYARASVSQDRAESLTSRPKTANPE